MYANADKTMVRVTGGPHMRSWVLPVNPDGFTVDVPNDARAEGGWGPKLFIHGDLGQLSNFDDGWRPVSA